MTEALPALHVLLYSEVLRHSGGRETWLWYFLPVLARRQRFRSITVYQMRPSDTEEWMANRLPECEGTPIRWVASAVELHGNETAMRRFAEFTRTVLGGLRQEARAGDLLVPIGVHGEGPPTILAWAISRLARRGLVLVPWIQEGSLQLIRERRGAVIHSGFLAIRRVILSLAHRVVTNGADTQAIYERQFPRLRDKLVCIPNAVDYAKYAGLPLARPDGPLRVAYVARFIRAKGFFDFLKAAQEFSARFGDDGRVTFSAWGHRSDPIDAVPDNVTLHDPVPHDEVPNVLAQCDVILILNRTANLEMGGLSHGLLEALASGRAVVAWDNHCHRQVLSETNSYLLPEGDVGALTELFSTLANDAQDLTERAAAGRQTASEHSHEAHVDRFLREIVDPLKLES